MNREIISIADEEAEPFRLIWTNEKSESFRYVPHQFTVTVDAAQWRRSCPTLDALRLDLPPTWVSEYPTWRRLSPNSSSAAWRIAANELPRSFTETLSVVALSDGREIFRADRTVNIAIHAFSQFDPETYVIRKPNSVAGWGILEPSRETFEHTYGLTAFRDRFFRGLYRSIVFLDASNDQYQGGVCTGMTRAALERSLKSDVGEPSLDEVLLWHGRQLTDRALIASARWLFFSNPRGALQAWRREILSSGTSSRCFDIGVPLPWRRDLVSALQHEGHSVVPFAFQQSATDRVSVAVYDPNDPEGSIRGSATITFRLDEGTYSYPPLGDVDLSKTTIIAVEQEAYRGGRTAILAGLASATLSVASSLRETWESLSPVIGRLRRSRPV